ncbi:MAG: THUMP domain-containing protein [Candidatus Jordarchaeum sp.]|uniref:THUMP domain-containing protein n=1 Tax=Candidatus Jordarchaeum sp. TaxID=2823881 RepID=UPI00404B3793
MIQDQFYVLSGENPTIPSAECLAILESLNIPFKAEKYDQVLVLKVEEKAWQLIAERAAMVHRCCILLAKCEAGLDQIVSSVREIDFERYISDIDTFAVRIKRVKNYSPELDSSFLEKEIGYLIHKNVGLKANLKNPDKLFYGVLTESMFIFGISVRESERKKLSLRKAKFRPFFVPSSMNPHLARAMVNLSRARPKRIFYDPFCGAGGILIEAGLMGCKIIGSDIDIKMVKGVEKNLKHFKLKDWNIIMSDAKNLPINRVDSIATDPPYGGSASTKGTATEKLISAFIEEIASISGSIGNVCIGAPLTIDFSEKIKDTGLRIIEKHLIYVHKSLTRQIIVLRM